jgi:hypothetical protein
MHFISAAVILRASLAVMVQFPLPYSTAGRANALYNFILVFVKVFLWCKHVVYNACYFKIVIPDVVTILFFFS